VAAAAGWPQLVRELVAAGADATLTPSIYQGSPPLHVAAGMGHTEVVRVLLWAGVDASQPHEGHTALHCAEDHGHPVTAELLRHPERHTRTAALQAQREAAGNQAAVATAVLLRRRGVPALPPAPPPLMARDSVVHSGAAGASLMPVSDGLGAAEMTD